MYVWKWSYNAIVEAVEPFKLHPTSMQYIYKVFKHLKQLWMGIWQHIHTVTTTEVSPDSGKFSKIIDDVNVETIPLRYQPFKLHPTSMWYIYKVFDHLKQLWMGIWQHIHTVTTTDVSPDLGEFAEIIDYVIADIIQLRYHWSCRTFQTASHIHVIQI
jgi:hypothetical protein